MKKALTFLAGVSLLAIVAVVGFAMTVGIAILNPQIEELYVRNTVGAEVVKVYGERGTGTGFYLKHNNANIIMTNRHVCALKDSNGNLLTVDYGKKNKVSRKVLFEYEKADLCVLSGDGKFHGLELSEGIILGTRAYTVGHPSGQPLTVSYGSYIGDKEITIAQPKPLETKNGIIYILMYEKLNTHQFHIYARGGSSGSPITDITGKVISVLFAGSRMDNLNTYGVPLTEIKKALKEYDKQSN